MKSHSLTARITARRALLDAEKPRPLRPYDALLRRQGKAELTGIAALALALFMVGGAACWLYMALEPVFDAVARHLGRK